MRDIFVVVRGVVFVVVCGVVLVVMRVVDFVFVRGVRRLPRSCYRCAFGRVQR